MAKKLGKSLAEKKLIEFKLLLRKQQRTDSERAEARKKMKDLREASEIRRKIYLRITPENRF